MAKFKEHISVAAVVNASVCTAIFSFKILAVPELIFIFFIGILGTMIPDLDSDSSKPLKLSYNILSFTIPFVFIYFLVNMGFITDIKSSFKQLFFIYLISFFTVFVFFRVIMRLTKHRGIIHSVPMSIIVSYSFMLLMYYFSYEKNFILLSGWLLFLGYITHLLLDELYSIVKLQKSFGSAFKFYSRDNIYGSLVMYILIFILFYIFPYKLVEFQEIIKYFKDFFGIL